MKNPTYLDEKTTGNKQSNTKHTHKNHQTGWSQQRPPHPPPKPPINKPKPPIRNPCRWFETHRSKPIQKKSSPEPPLELPMINRSTVSNPNTQPRPTTPLSTDHNKKKTTTTIVTHAKKKKKSNHRTAESQPTRKNEPLWWE